MENRAIHIKDQDDIYRRWIIEGVKGNIMQIRHGFAVTHILHNKVIKMHEPMRVENGVEHMAERLYYDGRVPYKDNYNEEVKEYSLFYSGIN